jgi:glycosyltransferase involved in cell wall biosynthesis
MKVCVGIPTYNGGTFVRAALDSLLSQTFDDAAFVLVDDASTDDTVKIAREFASRDSRLSVYVNPVRLGMVENWNLALAHAREAAPDAEYFAWASDHDLWDPLWLAHMVRVLDQSPHVVLAYPVVQRFDDNGCRGKAAAPFDTVEVAHGLERLRAAQSRMPAGDMIYGLFRLSSLDSVLPFPSCIYPDRLLLARLTLLGRFAQVPRVLWYRRVTAASTPRRQRRTLFASDRAPRRARLPWWLIHAHELLPLTGATPALRYAGAGAYLAARSVPSRLRHRGSGASRRQT